MPKNNKQNIGSKVEIDVSIFTDDRFATVKKINVNSLEFYIAVKILINENSFFIKWSDDIRQDIADKLELTVEEIDSLLQIFLDVYLFDKDVFTDTGIITNKEIQKTWYDRCKRRKVLLIDKRIMLISEDYMKSFSHWKNVDSSQDLVKRQVKEALREANNDNNQPVIPKQIQQEVPVEGEFENKPWDSDPEFTGKMLHEFISVPWDKQNEIFRREHAKDWWEAYVKFSNYILKEQKTLLPCRYQITFPQFKQITSSNSKGGAKNFNSCVAILQKMAASGLPNNNVELKSRFLEFVPTNQKSQSPSTARPKILSDNTKSK